MRIAMRSHGLLALLLLGIVFVSGCINQPPTTKGGKGLSISSFAPDFAEIRSGEPVTISALVSNVGEGDATGVKAQLFGLNMGAAGENKEWTLTSGSSTLPAPPSSGLLLRKADSSLGLSGENYEFTWTVKSPDTLRVDNTYTANLRVYYKYKTYSTSILHFVSYDYIKSLPTEQFNAEKAKAGVAQSTSSTAPVSVKVSGGNRPFIAYSDDASAPDTFSVQIDITNVDSGNAFDTDATYPTGFSSDNLHKVKVNIETNLDLNCANTLGSAKSGQITMTKGQSKTIFCTATVEKAKLDNARDYTVNVELDYGYYLDASTKITVLKKEGPITGGTGVAAGTKATILTLKTSLDNPKINNDILLSGRLTSDGTALPSRAVTIAIGGSSKTATTDSNGDYSTTYKIPSADEFKVKATFAGDSTYAASTSSEITIKPQSVYAYYPTCTITETSDYTYYNAGAVTLFYQPSIADFKVSVNPGAATSKVTKVSFPATTSDAKDVSIPQDGTSYSNTYAIRTSSDFKGQATVTVYYTDGATASCIFYVGLDNVASTTTFDKQQIAENRYKLALYCSDGTGESTGSGCAKTYYCLGSGCTPSTQYSSALEQTCTDKCYISYKSVDNVNNIETVKSATFGLSA